MREREPIDFGTEEWARRTVPPHVSDIYRVPHDPNWCCASVLGDWFGSHQCRRKPRVFYGELGYCGQHDPAVTVQRIAAKVSANAAKYAEQDRQCNLKADALSALKQIAAGHNDPRALAIEVLAKHGEPVRDPGE